MAKIRDYAITEQIVATTTLAVEMPVHEIGDLLLVFAAKDGGALHTTVDVTWTRAYTSTANAQGSALFYKFATTTSESLTLTSASDEHHVVTLSIKGAGGVHAGARGSDATNPYNGVALTTTVDNCLIIHGLATDGGLGPMCSPGFINVSNGDSSTVSMAVAYTYQKTAGAVTVPEWYGGATDGTAAFTVAISDDGSGDEIPVYVDYDNPGSRLVQMNTGGANINQTWLTSLSLATIGSQTTLYDAISVLSDSGVNPYLATARLTPLQNSAGTILAGSQTNFTSAEDLSDPNGYYIGTFAFTTPRDWVDLSLEKDGGFVVIMRDASDNYKAWTVGAKRSATTKSDARNTYAIQVEQTTDTTYATSGTLDTANIASVLYLIQNKYGAVALSVSHTLWISSPIIFAGGSGASELNFDDVNNALNACATLFPLSQRAGSATTIYAPLKFGGFEPIRILVNLRTFQTPVAYDGNYVNYHVDAGHIGYEFHGVDGSDTIEFLNCVFTSDTPYYWRFNAAHSDLSGISFAGTSVVGANVTLQSTVELANTTFIECPLFDLNDAALTHCLFNDVTIQSISSLEFLDNCSFSSNGTGHAVDLGTISSTQSMDWQNDSSGYAGTDGSTGNEVIRVSVDSGQILTINVVSGYSAPSIKNDGLGTVNVVSGLVEVKVTATDINGNPIENAIVILTASNGTGPFPYFESVSIVNSGTTATVTHTAHGMSTGDKVAIEGGDILANNGVFTITVIGPNSYSYTMLSTPGASPTGTINATFVALFGYTDINGEISTTRSYPSNQPITGRSRKSSSAPYYQTSVINGEINSSVGLNVNAIMLED